MTLREEHGPLTPNCNPGVITVNTSFGLANDNNGSEKDFLSSVSLIKRPQSKSKVLKKHAIHLILFCLKSGITKNKEIAQLLKENKVVLKSRTFDRYKSIAEKELENDLGADIWLSEKVQNALVHDYKDISDRYDKQLAMDDMLIESLIKEAVDKAMEFDNDPAKYYKYLDFSEMMKVQAMSNFTSKCKLDLISRGFVMYKIKQHIESLREQLNQKENKTESKELDLNSLTFLPKSNSSIQACETQDTNYRLDNEVYDQEYLDQNDLAISMSGRPIKKYLAEIEKKLGKPLSTL
jgi:hypothetical protein